jgi:FkbM family methyltransferase
VINFSGLPSGSPSGQLLRLLLRLVPKGLVVPILQGPLRGLKWIVGSSTHGCWLGSYEFVKQRAIAASLRSGDVFFDIGANVGFYALLGSRYVGPAGKVCAFEPVPKNLAQLNRHLQLNSCANVTVFDVAVSDRQGLAQFDSSLGPSEGHLAPNGGLSVRIVTLDVLVETGDVPFPDVVKLDVEGAEAQVLRGAEKLLGRKRPKIFLATHGEGPKEDCIGRLLRLGYEVDSIAGMPLEESDELLAVPHTMSLGVRGVARAPAPAG